MTHTKFRQSIIQKHCQGKKIQAIAEELDLANSTVADVLKHYHESGRVQPKGKSLGRPRIVSDRDRRLLVKICKLDRCNTLRAITAQWNAETGFKFIQDKSGLSFCEFDY